MIHKDNLRYIKFNQKIFRVGKKNWEKWLLLLDEKIKLVTKDQNINVDINEDINVFNYEYILKNKKAQLFKEDDKFYTFNLYEEKVLVSNPDGIFCDYCSYTRYNSSPCIYRNCKNRKYGDFEFQMYKKINGKELDSKYNKNYININDDSDDYSTDTNTDEDN